MKFWDDEKSITLTRCVVVGDGVVHCSGRAAP